MAQNFKPQTAILEDPFDMPPSENPISAPPVNSLAASTAPEHGPEPPPLPSDRRPPADASQSSPTSAQGPAAPPSQPPVSPTKPEEPCYEDIDVMAKCKGIVTTTLQLLSSKLFYATLCLLLLDTE